MPDDRPPNVEPVPDLADLPVKPVPEADDAAPIGRTPGDPPAEDLTLPTE